MSEVIIGATFNGPRLSIDEVFKAERDLSPDYPNVEALPPMADEQLVEFHISAELDPSRTGPFLLRARSADSKWLCQVQRNKIYMNWVRLDIEAPGNYVGFSKVVERFTSICAKVGVDVDILSERDIRYYDVTYHDRIEWQDYVKSISELEKIMNYCPPRVSTPEGFNNIFSRYTFHIRELGGYGILSINTETSPTGNQVLKFENVARGVLPGKTFGEWIKSANEQQVNYFEGIFRKETLHRWQ